MKTFFSIATPRLLCLAFLSTAGLFTAACTKDDPVVNNTPAVDYAVVDENLIKKYLADNAITTAQRQPSGLYFVPVTTNSTAPQALPGNTVSVLYTGYLLDANRTIFDASSRNGNKPLSFILGRGQVIPGFDAGIALMHKGDKAQLIIPSALAYGERGASTAIPPNAVIRFEVELVDVQP